jgi:hypothetical protein
MQRITITISDDQAERLKDVQRITGAPISLQIRRALNACPVRKVTTDEDRTFLIEHDASGPSFTEVS